MRFNVKKFCANCVMFAGAVTALTGAAKSVIDLVPPGCTQQKAEYRAPAPPPPPRNIQTNRPIVLGPPEKIVRGPAAPAVAEPAELWWSFGPAMLIVGFLVTMLGRELKKHDEVKVE